MKIWAVTKTGLKECLRQRVVYFIFAISLVFVLMAKGCDVGTIRGENMLIGKETRQGIALGISFNGIVFWSIMLCGLLASQALTRDMDEGVIAVILARPLSRESFIAGRLLPVLIISALNLAVLGVLLCLFVYQSTGSLSPQLPLGFLFATLSLGLYCLMICCLSLFIPRLLAPLAGIAVYLISCWSSLPYCIDNLKFFWEPSQTVRRMHLLLPKFGDLQCIGLSIANGKPPFEQLDALAVCSNVVLYALAFWAVTVWVFKRREV